MTTRTFRQMGLAYGAQIANITAKIDNVVVYSGPVTTLDQPFPDLPNLDLQIENVMFSWTNDVSFTGNVVIEVENNSNATLLITEIVSNYVPIRDETGNIISSGANVFATANISQFGNTFVDGNFVSPSSINHDTLAGQWWFKVETNFVENFTIEPGIE